MKLDPGVYYLDRFVSVTVSITGSPWDILCVNPINLWCSFTLLSHTLHVSPPTGISLSDGSPEMKRLSLLLGLCQFNAPVPAGKIVVGESGYYLG